MGEEGGGCLLHSWRRTSWGSFLHAASGTFPSPSPSPASSCVSCLARNCRASSVFILYTCLDIWLMMLTCLGMFAPLVPVLAVSIIFIVIYPVGRVGEQEGAWLSPLPFNNWFLWAWERLQHLSYLRLINPRVLYEGVVFYFYPIPYTFTIYHK